MPFERRGGFRGGSGGGFRGGGSGGFRGGSGGSRNFGGPREMHKAVCSECHQECEVPFKPKDDRPVFCRDCFMKKKGFTPRSSESTETNTEASEESEESTEEEEL